MPRGDFEGELDEGRSNTSAYPPHSFFKFIIDTIYISARMPGLYLSTYSFCKFLEGVIVKIS
jgi:hypothetical protein